MKTIVLWLSSVLLSTSAFAQQSPAPSPAPAPERPAAGLNLNLKLDDATRRSLVSEPVREKGASESGGTLPALGAGTRTFDPATGSRPKSGAGAGPYPKDTNPGM